MIQSQIEAELAALLQAPKRPAATAEQLAQAERVTTEMIAAYAAGVATVMEAAG